MPALSALDAVVERLTAAHWKEREAIKTELEELGQQFEDRSSVLDHLESLSRGIDDLELRWEVGEVIEALTPPPEPEPEPEPEEEAPPDRPLGPDDVALVYEDPRGVAVHKTKVGDRWFLTQPDPRTGQRGTIELRPNEVQQLKLQLMGSPYWVAGTGA